MAKVALAVLVVVLALAFLAVYALTGTLDARLDVARVQIPIVIGLIITVFVVTFLVRRRA